MRSFLPEPDNYSVLIVTFVSLPDTPSSLLEIDATGLACPMPLLKAKQGLSGLQPGERLVLLATDPGSERDVRTFIKLSEHKLIEFARQGEVYRYLLEKGQVEN